MITKLYDAPGSLINEIFNITRNKKFRNLTADEMFTRNIPLARVVMFRNNVQSRSRRGTLKVLDPSPRNYVTAQYFVRLHVWTHALRTHIPTHEWLRPAPVYTMFRVFHKYNPQTWSLKEATCSWKKFPRRNFRIDILSLARVLSFPSASRVFSPLGSSITGKGRGRGKTCIRYTGWLKVPVYSGSIEWKIDHFGILYVFLLMFKCYVSVS